MDGSANTTSLSYSNPLMNLNHINSMSAASMVNRVAMTTTSLPSLPMGSLARQSSIPQPSPLIRSSSLGQNLSVPSLVRSTSAGRTSNGGGSSQNAKDQIDWRSFVSIEERTAVRKKLKEAYTKNCASYEDLISVVTAIDEEIVFASSSTRMDYFKTAIEWDNRLAIKKKVLAGHLGVNGLDRKRKIEDEGMQPLSDVEMLLPPFIPQATSSASMQSLTSSSTSSSDAPGAQSSVVPSSDAMATGKRQRV